MQKSERSNILMPQLSNPPKKAPTVNTGMPIKHPLENTSNPRIRAQLSHKRPALKFCEMGNNLRLYETHLCQQHETYVMQAMLNLVIISL